VLAVRADPFNAAGPHSDDPEGAAASRVQRLRAGSETWGEFRTPSLRNLGRGGPRMHAGAFPDLGGVLRFYSTLEGAAGRSHHQERVLQPLDLEEAELADLEAFLAEGLEGRPLPPALLAAPPSPLPD
jgi:cytochrome c peroxidase